MVRLEIDGFLNELNRLMIAAQDKGSIRITFKRGELLCVPLRPVVPLVPLRPGVRLRMPHYHNVLRFHQTLALTAMARLAH